MRQRHHQANTQPSFFLFNRTQSYLFSFLLLTASMISPSIWVSAAENKKTDSLSPPDLFSDSSSFIETAINPYPAGESITFFKSQQEFYQPKITSAAPLSKEGKKIEKALRKLLKKLQNHTSPDSSWINETLKSEVNGKPLKIVFVPVKEFRTAADQGRYLPETHEIQLNMDYYSTHKNEFWNPRSLETLFRHELWHCRQRMLNEILSPNMDSDFQYLTPFHNEEHNKHYLIAINKDMTHIDEFKHRLLQLKLTTSDEEALAHYPLSYKKMVADKSRQKIRKKGDKIIDKGYPLRVVEIKDQGKADLINLQITCQYYSFLYDYEHIKSNIEKHYTTGPSTVNPRLAAQYKQVFGHEYHPGQWFLEFDAFLTGEMPHEVLQKFFPNRAAYHQARKELAEQHSSKNYVSMKRG
jgi:hypothetical protein